MESNFVEKLFAKALSEGFTDCEIYFGRARSFDVRIFNGEISQYKNAYPQGFSFRGTYNASMGYAYSEKVSEDVFDWIIAQAKENSQIIEAEEKEFLFAGSPTYPEVTTYNPTLDAVPIEREIALAKEMEAAAYALDKRVISVDHCVLGSGSDELYITNTLGLNLHRKSNMAFAYLYARVEENGCTKVAGEVWHGRDLSDFSPQLLAKQAVDKALSYLGAQQAVSKKYPIIFDNVTAIDIFSTYAGIFFAEHVQKGFSLLAGKIGKKIASDAVTLCDDGVCEKSMGSVAFDSEGVATKQKIIIHNGTLQTYLYNLKSAAKAGVLPTGNGFKSGFNGAITTAPTNFYIKPSARSLDEMISSLYEGILITELSGLHAGTNTISGDFSLSADGFLIEDGVITTALEQMTIAGNFYELLLNIEEVGDDLRFDIPSMGTIGMPSMRIKELDVSGI